MRKLEKTIQIHLVDFDELDDEEQSMLKMAAGARRNAQAPYSRFHVGATIKGPIIHFSVPSSYYFSGCNVERANYTATTHAEQNAIDNMVAEMGPSKISKIALVGGPAEKDIPIPPFKTESTAGFKDIIAPCGHCLQIIWENCMADDKVEINTLCPNGKIAIFSIDDAFPIRFGPNDLGVKLG